MINCPECGNDETRVLDSRPKNGSVYRRRTCVNGHRWTTYEINLGDEKAVIRTINDQVIFKIKRLLELALKEDV